MGINSASGRRVVTRLAAIPVTVAVLAGGLLVNAQPAQAAQADCPAARLCFWTHGNFTGPMGTLTGTNLNWSVFRNTACVTGTWNDCASSVWNRTSDYMRMHKNAYPNGNFQAPYLNLAPGVAYGVMPSVDGESTNDWISSNRRG